MKAGPGEKSAVKAADYEMVKRDLDKVIELAPDLSMLIIIEVMCFLS